MPRKNKVQNFSQLQVVDISAKGAGVAKTAQGQVLFVPGAIPGDLINATAFKKRKGVLEGRLNTIEQPSPHRIDPKCDYFGTCGGCKWQNMSYPAQLEFKQNIVSQNLYKIGHIIPQETLPIKGADEVYFYRNKMEFSFSNQRWLEQSEIAASETILTKNGLGFHKPGMWDKVVDIQQCHLQGDPSNAIRNWIKAFAESKGLAFFDPRNQSGFLRTLMIRNTRIGEIMVLIQFFHEDQENRIALLTALKAAFPQITSLLYCTNPKGNDSLYNQNIECFDGRDYIVEKMGHLEFEITAKSFYQTNSKQAEVLYQIAHEFAGLEGHEVVYDLYTGTGTIAQFIAADCQKVVGIEAVGDAVKAAVKNAKRNQIENTFFEVGDMKACFDDAFIDRHGRPDVIITDPPRDGMHPKVIAQLLKIAPHKIVYVSCNSATQARDLAMLKEAYEVRRSQAVDMFPQTHHIENVVLLTHR